MMLVKLVAKVGEHPEVRIFARDSERFLYIIRCRHCQFYWEWTVGWLSCLWTRGGVVVVVAVVVAVAVAVVRTSRYGCQEVGRSGGAELQMRGDDDARRPTIAAHERTDICRNAPAGPIGALFSLFFFFLIFVIGHMYM